MSNDPLKFRSYHDVGLAELLERWRKIHIEISDYVNMVGFQEIWKKDDAIKETSYDNLVEHAAKALNISSLEVEEFLRWGDHRRNLRYVAINRPAAGTGEGQVIEFRRKEA